MLPPDEPPVLRRRRTSTGSQPPEFLRGWQTARGRRARSDAAQPPSGDAGGRARWCRSHPAPESHLLDLNNSHETPAEEFRTLRTRLNHLQTLQPLHTVVVTSPSPAEGKTFTAVNLALAQSHLAESSVLLGDFDLRRPIVHNLFQIDRAPGLSRLT